MGKLEILTMFQIFRVQTNKIHIDRDIYVLLYESNLAKSRQETSEIYRKNHKYRFNISTLMDSV